MITGNTALLIAGIGISIILLYIFYLVLRLNCRLDTKLKPGCPYKQKSAPVSNDCPLDEYPEPESGPEDVQPKKAYNKGRGTKTVDHPLLKCNPAIAIHRNLNWK